MAPNITSHARPSPNISTSLTEPSPNISTSLTKPSPSQCRNEYKWDILWKRVVFFFLVHLAGLYGVYFMLSFQVKFLTYIFTWVLALSAPLGLSLGVHRLWSHKSFKANTRLRVLLMIIQSSTCQYSIYRWVRDHRLHHKYVDTDADPYNAKRGFFFSHIGWLFVRRHQEVDQKIKNVGMTDIEKDSVVMFQKKYYFVLAMLFCFILPTLTPVYLWGEDLKKAFFVCGIFRFLYALHVTSCINSFAHIWGSRPYDKNTSPTDNVYMAIVLFGEGWHDYHHAFPWDYKTSEYSAYGTNFSQVLIEFFAWLGWAYDLKTVTPEMVARRVARTGDGSHPATKTLDEQYEHDDGDKHERPVGMKFTKS